MSLPRPGEPSGNAAPAIGFAFLCLFWGSTWIAIKLGVQVLPPLLFAGLRFLAAGCCLTLWLLVARGGLGLDRAALRRLLGPAMLMITFNFGIMTWGIAQIPSGLAALLNLGTIPIAMLGWAIALGQERPSLRGVAALVSGIAGLLVLFGPGLLAGVVSTGGMAMAGMAAIVIGAVAYALGSVVGRPLGGGLPVVSVAAWQMLAGGAVLTVIALLVEPVDAGAWQALARPAAWGSLAYLVAVGSLLGFTVYLWLLQRWPASRVAAYAFVSPVVAVGLGWLVLGETIAPHEAAAALLLLFGAYLSMGRRA